MDGHEYDNIIDISSTKKRLNDLFKKLSDYTKLSGLPPIKRMRNESFMEIKTPGEHEIDKGAHYETIDNLVVVDTTESRDGKLKVTVKTTPEFRAKYGDNAIPCEDEHDEHGNKILVKFMRG